VGCSALNSTTLKISFSAVPSSNIQLTINSIRNYQIPSYNVSFQAQIYSSADYGVEATSVVNVSYTATAITSATVSNNNQIALN
jgi:hypothetical protein